jgi:Tfp pilus assembly protein FimT
MKQRDQLRGANFSLTELLIVVAIVLVIVATAIPNLLLAGVADGKSLAARATAWTKFLR